MHLDGAENLEQMARARVTTGLDMGTWPLSLRTSLRNRPGFTDIRSSGVPATAPGSRHSRIPGRPVEMLVSKASESTTFVADRVAEGSDYVKIIADIPGPEQPTVNALVAAAHKHGKLATAHAISHEAASMAQEAKVDVLMHTPLDKVLENANIESMKATACIAVPTLIMMKITANNLSNKVQV